MNNRRRLDLGPDYRKMNRVEDSLQTQVVKYLALQETMGRLTFFSVPNAGKRTPRGGAWHKRMGLRPGCSDLVVILPGPHVLFLELKSPEGAVRPTQDAFLTRVARYGCFTLISSDFTAIQGYVDGLVKAFPQRRAA